MNQTEHGRSGHDMTYRRQCPGLLLLIMRNITKSSVKTAISRLNTNPELPNMKECQPLHHEVQTYFTSIVAVTINKNTSSCILCSLQSPKRAKTCLLDICDKLFTYASSASAIVVLANWQKITLILAAEAQTNLKNQLTSTLHRRLT
jgi:hypothetical protein